MLPLVNRDKNRHTSVHLAPVLQRGLRWAQAYHVMMLLLFLALFKQHLNVVKFSPQYVLVTGVFSTGAKLQHDCTCLLNTLFPFDEYRKNTRGKLSQVGANVDGVKMEERLSENGFKVE